MLRILQDVRFYIFIFRWFALLSAFLFYTRTVVEEYPFLLVLIGINVIYTLLLFYPIPKRSRILLIMTDLAFNVVLISQTGRWLSPFLPYAYTSLCWLGTYVWGKAYLLIIAAYFISCLIIPHVFVSRYELSSASLQLLYFIFQLSICVALFLVSGYLVKYGHTIYRRLVMILQIQKRLPLVDSLSELSSLTERTVERIYAVDRAYLCWTGEIEEKRDFLKQHYLTCLLADGKMSIRRPCALPLTDYTGCVKTMFLFPLVSRGITQAVILFEVKGGTAPHRFSQLFLQLLASAVLNQGHQLRLRREIAAALDADMRKRMAQDMHDGLAQQLFFLSTQIFRIKQQLSRSDSEQITGLIRQVERKVQDCHLEVRRYIQHLRYNREDSHLFDAVRQLLDRLTDGSEIRLHYDPKGRAVAENIAVEEAIYRFVEEAVSNVLKHAQAKEIHVDLEVSSVQWTVKIRDDGIGFDSEKEQRKSGSFGLVGMEERINRAGGALTIRSELGKGTVVSAIIPRGSRDVYV